MRQKTSQRPHKPGNRITRRQLLTTVGAGTAGAALLPLVAPWAAGMAPAATAVPAGPIKIGALVIRAGVAAQVGQDGQRGIDWWADRVNKAGGIGGRKVQLIYEPETDPRATIDRFRKLVLQDKVDVVVGGISTGVGDALGPVVEEMGTLWLSWDATTQLGVKEAIVHPTWSFRSTDNEAEDTGAGLLTARFFKNVKTIAGINDDYSYGHDGWEDYQFVLNRLHDLGLFPNKPQFVLALFPKLGTVDYTSHIAAIQKAKPDLLMSSFWSGGAPIFFKQAAGVGLLRRMKGVFTTAGGVADALKKAFVPEGILVGYNSFYFADPKLPPLGKEYVKYYHDTFGGYPSYESDHAYFTGAAYQAAVENALKRGGGWPSPATVRENLQGIEVESLSGKRSYTKGDDQRMVATWFQGITTHKNPYDFVTINPIERLPLTRIQKPTAGTDLHAWINGWKIGPDGLPESQ